MHIEENEQIYQNIKHKNIPVNCVCEVGVYLPETSNAIYFIQDGIETILVEPEPETVLKIKQYFADYPNLKLHQVAVYDYTGKLSLSKANASTFITELPLSPALANDGYTFDSSKNFEVDCVVFSEIDNGKIDFLSIDIEGAEWFVLKNLVSRPNVISIETHGKFYKNPYLDLIIGWMRENRYSIWYESMTDTVYYKNALFTLEFAEKMMIIVMDFRRALLRAKKYILWFHYFLRAKRRKS